MAAEMEEKDEHRELFRTKDNRPGDTERGERGERTPEFLILPVRWEEGSAC